MPLRVLRDGALKVAHTDLEEEIARVKAGGAEPIPEPLPVYTTEEIGQVAHAVDELHTQALLLAGDEARLRLLVNDMFETMSRRSRSLVDQQLSLIDRLERNEEDPERLDNLFRLDHLAARLRRNSANLLVLAGAQLARDQREPVPLSTVINAAVSEVEDYRRVEIAGAARLHADRRGGRRRHPPVRRADRQRPALLAADDHRSGSPRRAAATAACVLRIADSGLGMNDADRRMANMRLQAGGEVTPDNARHMGLFVVGRIAARHGIRVGLRGPAPDEAGTGTTAEIYLPPAVLAGLGGGRRAAAAGSRRCRRRARELASAIAAGARWTAPPSRRRRRAASREPVRRTATAPGPPITLLPRRNPGSSGITEVPAQPAEQQPRQRRRELRHALVGERQQRRPQPEPEQPRSRPRRCRTPRRSSPRGRRRTLGETAAQPATPRRAEPDDPARRPPPARPTTTSSTGGCCRRCWATRTTWCNSPDLDWQSVWDRGWSLAAEAEDKPVEAHTDHGLPVRTPGARLVPGAANGTSVAERDGPDEDDGSLVGSNGRPAAARRRGARPRGGSRLVQQPFRWRALRTVARPRDE